MSLSDAVLAQVRARVLPLPLEVNDTVAVERRIVPGPEQAPDIELHIYRPANPVSRACIYHIHGGGYVTGNPSEFSTMLRPLAESLGCVIVSVDYRLAPETRHPGPVEDCYAGLVWLHANCAPLGVDSARIGVMGESAGGGLAAVPSIRRRA